MAHLCISNHIIDIFDRKEKKPVLVSRIVLAGGIFQIIIQYNCILFFDMSDDYDSNWRQQKVS